MPDRHLRNVPFGEWPSFFERFSREHRTWRASVHGIQGDLPITGVTSIPLESVSLDMRGFDHVVRLRFINGVSLCVLQPRDVRVEETDDGIASGLEIDSADGAFVRVAFRATALPEQLDGLAPGEAAGVAAR
jgi:hypothetical protein